MDWFSAVGERVEAEWRAAGRDEEAFPGIAAGVVADWPAVTHVDVDAFVRASLGTERPTAQFAPPGACESMLGATELNPRASAWTVNSPPALDQL